MHYKHIALLATVLHTAYSYSMENIPCQLLNETQQEVTFYIPPCIWEAIIRFAKCEHIFKTVSRRFRALCTMCNTDTPRPLANHADPIVPNPPPHNRVAPKPLSSYISNTLEGLFENRKPTTVIVRHPNRNREPKHIPILMQHNTDDTTAADLYKACILGNATTVLAALKRGLSLTPLNLPNNPSPLHLAAQHARLLLIGALLQYGIPINTLDSRHATPLYYAVEKKQLPTIKYLADNGADVAQIDKLGNNLLHIAVHITRDMTILNYLLNKDAIPINHTNASDETPLVITCKTGTAIFARLLIAYGANINQNSNQEWPCDIAYANKQFDIVTLLLEHGACHGLEITQDALVNAIAQEDIPHMQALLTLRIPVTDEMFTLARKAKNKALITLLHPMYAAILEEDILWIETLLASPLLVTQNMIDLAVDTHNQAIIDLLRKAAPKE